MMIALRQAYFVLIMSTVECFKYIPAIKMSFTKIFCAQQSQNNLTEAVLLLSEATAANINSLSSSVRDLSENMRNLSCNLDTVHNRLSKHIEQTSESVRSLSESVKQLISGSQNEDRGLEYQLSCSLFNYLTKKLHIPASCVQRLEQQEILNISNGKLVAEWDAIFLINYCVNEPEIAPSLHFPVSNTLVVLEAQQNLKVDVTLPDIHRKLTNTFRALNSTHESKRKKNSGINCVPTKNISH